MTRIVLIGLLSMVALPVSAQAPSDSTLGLALRLATEGQGDSARRLVAGRLSGLSPADTLYPEALYVSGVVARDADQALAAFRRLSIEFSQSRWAGQALLRIAQMRFAAGDLHAAGQTAQRVLEDYPFSDARGAAAYWVARARLEQNDLRGACGYLRDAVDQAGEDVELANRARFYLQRCADLAVGDSVAADSVTRVAPRDSTFSVQVAAVQTAGAADQVMRTLAAAGFDAHVVRDDDGLLKVRVGRYRTRAEATRVQRTIRERVGGSPFVVGEQ